MKRFGYLTGLFLAVVTVAIVLSFAPHWLTNPARVVAAYNAGAIVLLTFQWTYLVNGDPVQTRKHAAVQDPGRLVVFFVVLLSVAVGLMAAIGIIGRTPGAHHDRVHLVSLGLAISAVALGWLLIHSSFAFRYAHLYYRDSNRDLKADAGLIFPGTVAPNDFDFAYFSFVLGMTFQVSDVQITRGIIRRVALAHALVSFGYNAAIFAVTVNVLASLVQAG